jgi:hypothetical protein
MLKKQVSDKSDTTPAPNMFLPHELTTFQKMMALSVDNAIQVGKKFCSP